MKSHYSTAANGTTACRRAGRVLTANVFNVTCVSCKNSAEYVAARETANAAREAAFHAQEPRNVRNVWDWTTRYVCSCGCDLWRERPRSLHSYHYVCAGCGHSIQPPTETGMCQ